MFECASVRVCGLGLGLKFVGMDIDYKMILVHKKQISLVGSRLPENLSYHNSIMQLATYDI